MREVKWTLSGCRFYRTGNSKPNARPFVRNPGRNHPNSPQTKEFTSCHGGGGDTFSIDKNLVRLNVMGEGARQYWHGKNISVQHGVAGRMRSAGAKVFLPSHQTTVHSLDVNNGPFLHACKPGACHGSTATRVSCSSTSAHRNQRCWSRKTLV